jgi:hypothetical protein
MYVETTRRPAGRGPAPSRVRPRSSVRRGPVRFVLAFVCEPQPAFNFTKYVRVPTRTYRRAAAQRCTADRQHWHGWILSGRISLATLVCSRDRARRCSYAQRPERQVRTRSRVQGTAFQRPHLRPFFCLCDGPLLLLLRFLPALASAWCFRNCFFARLRTASSPISS